MSERGDSPISMLDSQQPRAESSVTSSLQEPTAKPKRSWLSVSRLRVPLGFVLAAVFVVRAQPTPASVAIGLPLAAAGLLLRALASGHIRKNDALATTGPYRFTRNPLYFGSALLAAGFVLAARDWLMAALAAAMLAGVYFPVIRKEEQYLAGRFGESFAAYRRQVPRFFPRMLAARNETAERGCFSKALYLRHREYNALIGFVALTLVLLFKLYRPGGWAH